MPSVSVDSVSQTNPTANRARSGRDNAPASNDQFGMFVDETGSAGDKDAPRTSSPSAPSRPASRNTSAAAPSPQQGVASSTAAQSSAASEPTVTALRPQDKPALAPTAPGASDETDDTDPASEAVAADETAVPVTVFVALQAGIANINVSADTTIESSETASVVNPPVTQPGGTAALALARVAQDTATETAPDQTAAQVPAQATATENDQSAQNPAPVPAVIAPDQATGNAALETATDLTTRVPVEAIEVEADAKLQATIAAAQQPAEHGRMIAAAVAQPLLSPLKPLSPSDSPTLKPADNQEVANPSATDLKAADARPTDARPTPVAEGRSTDAAPQIANDKASTSHTLTAVDVSAQFDATSGVLPTHTQSHTVANAPQLTATSANPNVAVPVAALAIEIASNVQIGRSRFEIRLDPPELGRIEVKLDVDRQGQVTSHIIVEKAATLDLLRRDAPQLERALQDAGLKTSDNGLQFSLRDQSSQGGRPDDGDNRRNAHHLMITEDETVPRQTAGHSYGRMLGSSGGIDMRV